jgi:hypothetical protein
MLRSLKSFSRSLAQIAIAAAAIMAPAANAYAGQDIQGQSNWKANEDDAILLDLRSGKWRVGDGVRGYQTDTGVCVDFADVIMAMDLPVRLDKKSRRATGWLLSESRLITLDRDQNIVQIVNKNVGLAANDIRDTPEGWCVDTKALTKWLGVSVTPDLSNSLLMLKADFKLPFELAEERKERAGKIRTARTFDLDTMPQASDPIRPWREPSIDVVASTGVTKDKLRGATFDARYEIFASGEIFSGSFDARLSSNDNAVPQSLRLRVYRTDPQASLLGPLKATHYAVGDVSIASTSLGSQGSVGRGAYVTNRPVERPENFDRTTVRGELPEGWEAELYRNDQLLMFMASRGDGRYEFLEVPLQFGQNRIEVVLYGPQGQVRRESKLIPVGLDSIPPKITYFWAGAQQAGRDLVNFGDRPMQDGSGWRGGVGVERGLNSRTSISAAFSTSMYLRRRRHALEASLRRSLGPALWEFSAASDLMGGYALRNQALAQIGETYLSAETAWFGKGYQSERFEIGLKRQLSLSADHSFKFGATTLPIHIDARQRLRANGDKLWDIGTRLTFNINNILVSTELEWEKDILKSGINSPDRLDANLRLSGRIGGLRLRGETEFGLKGASGLRESKLTGEWRSTDKAEWRAELGYNAPLKRGRASLGYTRKFEKFALTGQFEAASDGSVAAGLNLAFSIGPDPRGGYRLASDKLASMGQAIAIVYQDQNGDGIRQASEPLEKSVELTAGLNGKGLPTDATGASFIDGLQPFHPVLIGIDSSSLSDPFMQPATPGVVVTPRPGVAMLVELPLVAAGEISGTLQRESGGNLSGIDIELLDKNGQVIKTTRSEYDGYFLFESVPYGEYRLRVSALPANIVGVQTTLDKPAKLAAGNPTVDLGVVVAKNALRIAANEETPPKE